MNFVNIFLSHKKKKQILESLYYLRGYIYNLNNIKDSYVFTKLSEIYKVDGRERYNSTFIDNLACLVEYDRYESFTTGQLVFIVSAFSTFYKSKELNKCLTNQHITLFVSFCKILKQTGRRRKNAKI